MRLKLKILLLSLLLLFPLRVLAVFTWSQGGTNANGTYATDTIITSNGSKFIPTNATTLATWLSPYIGGTLSGTGTDNYIPYWISSTTLGNTNINYVGGNVAIGDTVRTAPNTNKLYVSGSSTYDNVYFLSNNSETGLLVYNLNDTDMTNKWGIRMATDNAGNVTNTYSIINSFYQASGNTKNYYGFYADNVYTFGGSSIDNNYAVYIKDQTGATNNYSIYSEGGKNYLGGDLQLGGIITTTALNVYTDNSVKAFNVAADTSWNQPMIYASGLTATPGCTSGSMVDGTYYYLIISSDGTGYSYIKNEVQATISCGDDTGYVDLTWNAVPGSVLYGIFRSTSSMSYPDPNILGTSLTNAYQDTAKDASVSGLDPLDVGSAANSTALATKINPNGNSFFNGGNVGIGTQGPDSKLHVVGTADQVQLKVAALAGQTSNLAEFIDNGGNTNAYIDATDAITGFTGSRFGDVGNSTYWTMGNYTTTLGFNIPILTPTSPIGTLGALAGGMYLIDNGAVGVGLYFIDDVDNSISDSISWSSASETIIISTSTNINGPVYVKNNTTDYDNTVPVITLTNHDSILAYGQEGDGEAIRYINRRCTTKFGGNCLFGTSYDAALVSSLIEDNGEADTNYYGSGLAFYTANETGMSEAMRISHDGEVLINMSSTIDDAYKLSVTGNLYVNGTADFRENATSSFVGDLLLEGGLEVRGALRDGNRVPGNPGQILSSNGTSIEWVDGTSYDQSLNTTDNVTFAFVTSTNGMTAQAPSATHIPLLLAGYGGLGSYDPSNGVAFVNSYNGAGNRQLAMFDSAQVGVGADWGFRFILGFPVGIIDGINGDQSAGGAVIIGQAGENVGIGYSAGTTQAQLTYQLQDSGTLYVGGAATLASTLDVTGTTTASCFSTDGGATCLTSGTTYTGGSNIDISGSSIAVTSSPTFTGISTFATSSATSFGIGTTTFATAFTSAVASLFTQVTTFLSGIILSAGQTISWTSGGAIKFDNTTTSMMVIDVDGNSKYSRIIDENTCYFDFFDSGTTDKGCYFGYGINSGVTANTAADGQERPGQVTLSDSTTVGGGYYYGTNQSSMILKGGEETITTIKLNSSPTSNATITARFGFSSGISSAIPANGVFIATEGYNSTSPSQLFYGYAINNNVVSTTGTSYNFATNTWYTLRVKINSAYTRADYYIYDASGNLLWTDYLTNNLPGNTRTVGNNFLVTEQSTDAAAVRATIDKLYMHYGENITNKIR